MSPPDVSVLIVAYRSREDLPACLESLGPGASGLRIETRVVDNASGDGTVEMLRERHPDVALVLNDTNRGFAAAVNQAAALAKGRRLLLLNPDARLLPGALVALSLALDSRPDAGLAGAQLLHPDGSPQASAWPDPGMGSLLFEALLLHNLFPRSRHNGIRAPGADPIPVDTLSGACLLVDRELFSALGGLDEGFFLYYEDADLCRRIRDAGRTCLLCPGARAVHALGGSAFQDRRAFFLRFHESRHRFLAKHRGGAARALLRAVHVGGVAFRAAVYTAAAALGGGAPLRERAGHMRAVLRRLV